MRRRLTNPAAQPIKLPPGKESLGTDCHPPSLMTRAPYSKRSPSVNIILISGCVLKRCNSS
ncbi:hypothetical protein FXW31_01650 [Candidatus Liberibacter asiaticus]|nr:hypothetical protein FXW31_01650 [Candidatus Liberibacter asiaticus]